MMSGMFRTGLTLGLLYLFNLTTVAQPVPEALKMAISGQENDEKKLELYKILLDSISTAERKDFLPVIKICSAIL
jgi:hypothetical protein